MPGPGGGGAFGGHVAGGGGAAGRMPRTGGGEGGRRADRRRLADAGRAASRPEGTGVRFEGRAMRSIPSWSPHVYRLIPSGGTRAAGGRGDRSIQGAGSFVGAAADRFGPAAR